jgi:hypothetical protein
VRLAAESEIPIYFFDHYGDADACLRSPYFESLATLRRKQVYFSDREEGADWVIRQFELKTEGQFTSLKYLLNRRKSRSEELKEAIETITARLTTLRKDYRGLPSTNGCAPPSAGTAAKPPAQATCSAWRQNAQNSSTSPPSLMQTHLISYDISDNNLRLKASKLILRAGGYRIQYSVFMGTFPKSLLNKLDRDLTDLSKKRGGRPTTASSCCRSTTTPNESFP